MGDSKSKPLSYLIFIPLLSLIFLRPFFSGLAYPILEMYYQICLIFLAIVSLFFSTHFVHSKNVIRAKSRTSSYHLPILLLLLAYIISLITSINIQNSLKEIIKFITYVSIFFLASQANDRQKRIFIKAIVIAASIISLYSIYQYFWGYQHTLDYLKKINSDLLLSSSYAKDILIAKRAIGTFPSPNLLGGYLIMVLFLAAHLLFERIHQRWASRELFSLLLISTALLLTKSMGAWLSLIVAFVILFLLSYKSIKKRKLLIIFSIIFIAAALGFILVTRWDRLMDIENPQNSITQRLNYWRTAIAVIKDHPFKGVGAGNFQEAFLQYKVGLGTNTRYAHNIFLHMWAETGILGMMGIFYLIINLLKDFKVQPKHRFIFFGSLAFILHNLIDNTYFISESSILWWVLLAL